VREVLVVEFEEPVVAADVMVPVLDEPDLVEEVLPVVVLEALESVLLAEAEPEEEPESDADADAEAEADADSLAVAKEMVSNVPLITRESYS
jgi:hypothetical protein